MYVPSQNNIDIPQTIQTVVLILGKPGYFIVVTLTLLFLLTRIFKRRNSYYSYLGKLGNCFSSIRIIHYS